MITTYFSSTSKEPLNKVVLNFLDNAKKISLNNRVEIQIMCFNFTDKHIYNKIKSIALEYPKLIIKIIADWGNISEENDRKLHLLAKLDLPNLRIRLKYDQPYIWDEVNKKLLWNYNTSLGLLHHRTLLLLKNDKPIALQTGSYNWTKLANSNYENIIQFESKNALDKITELLQHFKDEFSYIWNDINLSLSYRQSLTHLNQIEKQLKSGITPKINMSKPIGNQANLSKVLKDDDVLIAFNSKAPNESDNTLGFHPHNNFRSFLLRKPSGLSKKAPLSIVNLVLDIINGASKMEILYVAMFALSPRTPEFNALLQAARRGVHMYFILDKNANQDIIKKLKEISRKERIKLQVKSGKKIMHQKYIVNKCSGDVLTGTANITTDASERHWEHRILFRKNKHIATDFIEDFEEIWSRLS